MDTEDTYLTKSEMIGFSTETYVELNNDNYCVCQLEIKGGKGKKHQKKEFYYISTRY